MINLLILFRHSLSSTLMPAVALNWAVLILLSSCSINDSVREYFQSHDMVYPADVSGIDLLSIKFVGIERDELLEQGAREFVEEGVAFVKEYFKKTDVKSLMAGVEAITISKPVLFRDESGGVGLMVTVTGFGTGSFGSNSKLDPEWIGKDKRFWKVENFAFFNRNEFYKWQFGGWVY